MRPINLVVIIHRIDVPRVNKAETLAEEKKRWKTRK